MKFRMIWVGSEGEPDHQPCVPEGMETALQSLSRVRYEQRATEMVRRDELSNGRLKFTSIANFTARIAKEVVCDDDTEPRRDFCIEANVAGQRVTFVVPAAEFSRMNWVTRQLGPQAIIYPGQQQHVRAAIQSLSGPIQQERVFTHLGWTKFGQNWLYLQAGGAIGPSGTLTHSEVRVPLSLRHYRMCPPSASDQAEAVRSSLNFLSVAPDRISLPLFAAVYRAPFGGADFSLFLTGRTGTFKTAMAALCQQHFGAAMNARCLPAHFGSTANALEELAFCAKDALLVVDDFAPTGGAGDSALYAAAERLFRASGNHQGRGRMHGQRHLGDPRPPRSLILATGEEVPRGHSLRARLLILNINPGDVDQRSLSVCQRVADGGLFASAMGAYLEWTANRYEQQRQLVGRRSRAYKDSALIHPRLPTMLAELRSGWNTWRQFAIEIGAISGAEGKELELRFCNALQEAALNQCQYHQASDPASRFLSLLHTAMASGRAHLTDRNGGSPDFPGRCGWCKSRGRAWIPQGTRIGWLTATDLFLEPMVSYDIAQQMAGAERLPTSAQTLRHRLNERGLLASVDTGRQMLLVRRTLEGIPRQILHLKARDLVPFSTD